MQPTLGSTPEATPTATATRTAWSSPTPRGYRHAHANGHPDAHDHAHAALHLLYGRRQRYSCRAWPIASLSPSPRSPGTTGLSRTPRSSRPEDSAFPPLPRPIGSLTPLPTANPTRLSMSCEKGDNLELIARQVRRDGRRCSSAANELPEEGLLMIGQELVIPSLEPATPTPVRVSPTVTATDYSADPTATRTSTPLTLIYPRIEPLSPLPGSVFHGPDAQIVLSWAAADLARRRRTGISSISTGWRRSRNTLLAATVWSKRTSWRVHATCIRKPRTIRIPSSGTS